MKDETKCSPMCQDLSDNINNINNLDILLKILFMAAVRRIQKTKQTD